MSYSRFSTGIARYLSRELELEDEKKQILAYSIDSLTFSLGGFALVGLAGLLFDAFVPCMIAALSGGLLRRFSGGAHAKSPGRCLLYGTIGYGLLGVMVKKFSVIYGNGINSIYLLIPLAVSLILVVVYAPVDCAAKPIKSAALRKKLKTGSIVLVLLGMITVMYTNDLFFKAAVVAGIFYQSLTLVPILNQRR